MRKFIYITLTCLLVSCNNFLDQIPENQLTFENFYKSKKDIESFTRGLEARFRETFGNSNARIYRQRLFAADYITPNWSHLATNDLRQAFKPDDNTLRWDEEYKVIALANMLLDHVDLCDELTQAEKDKYRGIALGYRANTTFYILKMWGDAPSPTDNYSPEAKPRLPWQQLADLAEKDYQEAARLLPLETVNKQQPSRGQMWAFLAHLYAWRGGVNNQPELFSKGIAYADSVISCKIYSLEDNIHELCETGLHRNSKESICELLFSDQGLETNRKGACLAWCLQKYPIEPMTKLNTRRTFFGTSFEKFRDMFYDSEHDERFKEFVYDYEGTIGLSENITQGLVYFQKFRHALPFTSGPQINRMRIYDNSEILLRLADIILLRAELRAKAGDIPGAVEDLNTIRSRAKATPYTYTDTEDLMKAIARERSIEFLYEGDNNDFYYHVRNKTYNELPGYFKTLTEEDVKNGALYLPVAIQFFTNNPYASQTPYWAAQGF